jgi:hypothetical protein
MAEQITTTVGTISGTPDRDDPDNFNTESDAFFEDLPDAITDINAVAGEMNTLATSVEQDAADAETAKTAAEAAQVLAVAAANATVYAAGTTYAAGDIVLDPGNDYVAYTSQQGSNTGHTPNSDDGTWWEMTIDDVANSINSATAKTTPVDADLFGLVDSAASNVLKKLTWANIKATLKTYFDTFYAYDTIWIGAGAMIPCTTNPAETSTEEYGTNDIDSDILAFDAGATEERAQFTLAMPETWDRSTVKIKFFWANAAGASASDTVEWGIKAGALSNDDAIDAALGTPQVITDTVIADGDLHITSATPALTIGGTPALDDMIQFEVYRNTDGTDDMAEDAWLIGCLVQYRKTNTISAW